MDNETRFWEMVDNEKNPSFLLFYAIKCDTPECSSKEEAKETVLEHLKLVNELDPMQLHGVKTDQELLDMVNATFNQSPNVYDHMYKPHVGIKKVVATHETVKQVKLDTESIEGFKNWIIQ